MDKKYIELFSLISQTTANLAEQVMNTHHENGEEKEEATARTMRDDFLTLHDKLNSSDELTKADYARLLVGAIIVTNQLDARIKNEQKALQGYKLDIIPKLDQINSVSMEEALALAQSLFEIKEETEIDKEKN